jgi:tetrahydromethanopterin S-methyltransferase subunit E
VTFKKGNLGAGVGRVCGLAWPILGRLGRLDSSSNLDRPTFQPLFTVTLIYRHGKRVVMANRWNVMQNKPKRKRRVTMDTYEFCTFLIFVSLGAIGVMILLKLPSGTFDHVSDSRNGVIGLGFVISGALLLKFDSNARARAAKKFDYDLAEYEMVRTKWLEMEATKIDMEKEHSIQYLAVDSSKPIIVESLPESKIFEVSTD